MIILEFLNGSGFPRVVVVLSIILKYATAYLYFQCQRLSY